MKLLKCFTPVEILRPVMPCYLLLTENIKNKSPIEGSVEKVQSPVRAMSIDTLYFYLLGSSKLTRS